MQKPVFLLHFVPFLHRSPFPQGCLTCETGDCVLGLGAGVFTLGVGVFALGVGVLDLGVGIFTCGINVFAFIFIVGVFVLVGVGVLGFLVGFITSFVVYTNAFFLLASLQNFVSFFTVLFFGKGSPFSSLSIYSPIISFGFLILEIGKLDLGL